MGFDKTTRVTAEQALPGRGEAMVVADQHVVLGTPLHGPWSQGYQVLYVGMGCFWGAERIFWRLPGVHSTAVGYMGGWTLHPTYVEVCTAMTGHAEVVQVVFDPAATSLEVLLGAFWENHDPTTANRQGGDIGTQYRSALFLTDEEQLSAARDSRQRYQAALTQGGHGQITTEIVAASAAGDGVFYYAEDYHQGYLEKNPDGYCNHGFCQVSYT